MNKLGLSQRLELRQSQALVMTPQLQQAIKMLQLSNLELAGYLDREIEENPLLLRQEHGGDGSSAAQDTAPAEPAAALALPETLAGDGAPDAAEHWHAQAGSEGDGTAEFGGDPSAWRSRSRSSGEAAPPGFEETATRPCTLREHLAEQIGADLADPGDRVIALHLLDLVDEAGYLRGPLDGIAAALGCEPARVEAVLRRVQQFDPPGVFARDLPECLALQLRDRDRLDPAIQALLDNLPLLAARNLAALTRICRVDAADLAQMIGEIRALDPRPGLAFDPPLAQPVVPDILMRAPPRGGWIVELNPETLPRVLVNNSYYARISQATRSKAEKDYLIERLHAANWLVKSLHQRAATILKVAAEIVRQQEGFFRHGVKALRPLILRDIADAIGLHESTVSRVTSNKFIATPRGLFELKYFFTASIPGSRSGEAHSAEAVRFRIRGMIEAEPAGAILSDERIVNLLRQEGVDIARRTVAKYREAMHIPSSAQRRRDKLPAI